MTVQVEFEYIVLRGNCPVEDAEALMILLQAHPDFAVDIDNAIHLHAAVLQVLLAFRPRLSGSAHDAFTQRWIVPFLTESEAAGRRGSTTGT
jgi:hypothetical protein